MIYLITSQQPPSTMPGQRLRNMKIRRPAINVLNIIVVRFNLCVIKVLAWPNRPSWKRPHDHPAHNILVHLFTPLSLVGGGEDWIWIGVAFGRNDDDMIIRIPFRDAAIYVANVSVLKRINSFTGWVRSRHMKWRRSWPPQEWIHRGHSSAMSRDKSKLCDYTILSTSNTQLLCVWCAQMKCFD